MRARDFIRFDLSFLKSIFIEFIKSMEKHRFFSMLPIYWGSIFAFPLELWKKFHSSRCAYFFAFVFRSHNEQAIQNMPWWWKVKRKKKVTRKREKEFEIIQHLIRFSNWSYQVLARTWVCIVIWKRDQLTKWNLTGWKKNKRDHNQRTGSSLCNLNVLLSKGKEITCTM